MNSLLYILKVLLGTALGIFCILFIFALLTGQTAIKTPCTELPGYCTTQPQPRN